PSAQLLRSSSWLQLLEQHACSLLLLSVVPELPPLASVPLPGCAGPLPRGLRLPRLRPVNARTLLQLSCVQQFRPRPSCARLQLRSAHAFLLPQACAAQILVPPVAWPLLRYRCSQIHARPDVERLSPRRVCEQPLP